MINKLIQWIKTTRTFPAVHRTPKTLSATLQIFLDDICDRGLWFQDKCSRCGGPTRLVNIQNDVLEYLHDTEQLYVCKRCRYIQAWIELPNVL